MKKPNRPKGPFDPIKQMRFDFEYAKRCITTDGHVLPVFVVHTANGLQPVGWGPAPYDDDAKRLHRNVTSLVCVAYDAVAVAYIGEAWIAQSLPDEPEPEFPRVRPSEREDRREIILAQLLWRDGEKLLAAMTEAEIVRNAKGDCIGVKNEETCDTTDVILGNFAHIMPPTRPTLEQQAVAKEALQRLNKSGLLQSIRPTIH